PLGRRGRAVGAADDAERGLALGRVPVRRPGTGGAGPTLRPAGASRRRGGRGLGGGPREQGRAAAPGALPSGSVRCGGDGAGRLLRGGLLRGGLRRGGLLRGGPRRGRLLRRRLLRGRLPGGAVGHHFSLSVVGVTARIAASAARTADHPGWAKGRWSRTPPVAARAKSSYAARVEYEGSKPSRWRIRVV